ncbi:MAG: hypothetical protein GY778_09705, partial [bacterium]|nr:hypothetical protein [bacterium]
MSRSIHRTKHDLERLERFDTSDDARRLAEIERAREELARKRRIKSQVQAERRGNVLRAAALPTEQITIRERDSGEYVHFPATPADLRALLNRLPGGASDALTLIELCLGKGYQKQQTGELYATAVPDPHTGRIGHELIPGYFSGTSHGHYACETPIIRLFAYVYALSAPFRREIELFCKMLMLSTFVHELAHHHDFSMRVARERWLADQDDKLEMYAEQIQHEWVQQFVVPYLLETYPEEVAALDRWITHYGGAKIPLSMLAGDPRKTAVRGCVTEVAFF